MAEHKTHNDFVSLEVLYTHPLFWKPTKYIGFLTNAWNAISNTKQQVDSFLEELDKDAVKHDIFGTAKNWKTVLDKHDCLDPTKLIPEKSHCYYITTSYNNATQPSTMESRLRVRKKSNKNLTFEEKQELLDQHFSCVSTLLSAIRNKHQHYGDLPEEAKDSLNWFNDNMFDEQLFVQYWITRFPKLVPYLWIKFSKFREQLQDFYPNDLQLYIADLRFDLITTLNQFRSVLEENVLKVGITKRYVSNQAPTEVSLEMKLQYKQLELPIGTNITAVIITDHEARFIWNEISQQKENSLVYKYSSEAQFTNSAFVIKRLGESLGNGIIEKCLECNCKKLVFIPNNVNDIREVVQVVSNMIAPETDILAHNAQWFDAHGRQNLNLNKFMSHLKQQSFTSLNSNEFQELLDSCFGLPCLIHPVVNRIWHCIVPGIFDHVKLPRHCIQFMKCDIHDTIKMSGITFSGHIYFYYLSTEIISKTFNSLLQYLDKSSKSTRLKEIFDEQKISQLLRETQIDVLVNYCITYIKENKKIVDFCPDTNDLTAFVIKCIEIDPSFDTFYGEDISRQCHLIALALTAAVLKSDSGIAKTPCYNVADVCNNILNESLKFYLRKNGCNTNQVTICFVQANWDSMLQVNIYYALKNKLSENMANWFKDKLDFKIPETDEFKENVLAYGLIKSFEPFQFVHPIFEDFFVVLFLKRVVMGHSSTDIVPKNEKPDNDILQDAIDLAKGEVFGILQIHARINV